MVGETVIVTVFEPVQPIAFVTTTVYVVVLAGDAVGLETVALLSEAAGDQE